MHSTLPLLVAWAAVLSSAAGAVHPPRAGSAFVPQSAQFLPHSLRGATCSFPALSAEARLRVGAAPLGVRQGVASPKMGQTFDMEGTLKIVFDVQTIGDKGFTKREFVVTMADEKYPQDVKFELYKEKTDLVDSFRLGDAVKAWRLEGTGQSSEQYQQKTDASATDQPQWAGFGNNVTPGKAKVATATNDWDDDIPFGK